MLHSVTIIGFYFSSVHQPAAHLTEVIWACRTSRVPLCRMRLKVTRGKLRPVTEHSVWAARSVLRWCTSTDEWEQAISSCLFIAHSHEMQTHRKVSLRQSVKRKVEVMGKWFYYSSGKRYLASSDSRPCTGCCIISVDNLYTADHLVHWSLRRQTWPLHSYILF